MNFASTVAEAADHSLVAPLVIGTLILIVVAAACMITTAFLYNR